MSDFVADARILVRPDTTTFRAELITQLTAVTRGVTVPVPIVPVATGAGLANVTAQATAATTALNQVAAAEIAGANAARTAATAHVAHSKALGQVQTAAIAQAASLTGLRGAVLTAGASFLGATIAIQTFSRAVSLAAGLEEELNVFAATAGATADQMERVREAAEALGRDVSLPAVSAIDAAQAMSQLARAGLSVEDSIAGARGVLQLATAAQIDFATATELSAGALNAFGLNGGDAVRVADVLANASNEAQGSIEDMGLALRQSAAVARQVGLTLEETVAQLTILARAGITGSDAGTSLRVALTRLVAPTEAAQKALNRLNIDLRDADQTFRSDVFVQFGEALEDLSVSERAALLFRIFGQDAQRVAAILSREGAPALEEVTAALEREGAAAELAAARSRGLAGEARALNSNLETLGTTLGTAVLPFLSSLTRGLNIAVGGLNTLADSIGGIGGGGFDEANAQFSDLVARIEEIQDLRASFVGPEVERLTEQVQTLGQELLRVGATDRVIQAFRQASEEIDAALQDGVITPLERVQLETEAVGRAFLSIAPRDVLGGLGADVRSSIEDATASARVGVADLGAEIRSGIEDMSRDAAVAARTGGEEVGNAFAEGLRTSASRIQNQIKGIGQIILEADIAGDEGAQLAGLRQQEALIQREISIQEQIIAQGGAGAATARQRLRTVLLPQLNRVTDEIEAILNDQARRRQEIAREASDKLDRADRALLDALTNRREDLANSADALAAEGNNQAAIRALDALQALIRAQIEKVRALIKDEELRAKVIRQLRQALNESRREEAALREEQRKARQEAAADRQERQAEIQQLNIDIAIERGNDAAAARAIQARINTLNKQIKAAKGDQLRVKQLILERERLRNQLKDLNEQEKENQRSAQQFFFEQLQAQQGFAANLLGNIIPRDQTAGLVGVPAPTVPVGPGAGIAAAALVQQGKAQGGPSAGQVSTTNDILLRIERLLQNLNRAENAPEAYNQKKMGAAAMTGGGGNVDVL